MSAHTTEVRSTNRAERLIDIVRRTYACFAGGDIDALMREYDDDATHIVPGTSEVSGRHAGKAAILALYARLFELTAGTLRVELERLVTDGEQSVIASHTATMELRGETVVQTAAMLFTFRDGKVAEIRDFFADISLNDRVFA